MNIFMLCPCFFHQWEKMVFGEDIEVTIVYSIDLNLT